MKHSIRYFGIASDGSRVPANRSMKGKDWGWDATCACGWDSRTGGTIHARIVELVAAHKADAPLSPELTAELTAAALAPDMDPESSSSEATVSKAAAKSVGLPVGSATALLAYAKDAGNWSGTPWVNGNVNFGKSTGGYIGKLVAAGMITLGTDGGETFIVFTREGMAAAIKLGGPLEAWNYGL